MGDISEEEALSELWSGFDEERSRLEGPDMQEEQADAS